MRIIAMLLFFVGTANAGYNGSVSFTQSEKNKHKQNISQFTKVAAQCLDAYQQEHLDFYSSNCRQTSNGRVCLSKFYGERRYSKEEGAVRSDGTPLKFLPDALVEAGFSANYVDQMERTSCVGMTLDCLKQAFVATNQVPQWKKVMDFTRANGVGGTALQHGLRNLGWKVYYWNPSPQGQIVERMKAWDEEELNWKSKGHHTYRYNKVMNNGTYWFNKVDNKTDLVGFGSGEPEILQDKAFWVGTAHTGYHVFPGSFGDVVEAHSTRHITSKHNLEFSRFSPFASGGGPRWSSTEKYRSGLIAIPPSQ